MDQADILSSFGQEISLSGLRIQIVRVTHLRKAKTPWIIPDHAHVNWEFHYVLSGDATITTVGRDVQVQNGDLYITPPYYTHRQVCNVVSLEEYCIECNILREPPAIRPQKNGMTGWKPMIPTELFGIPMKHTVWIMVRNTLPIVSTLRK